jgi:hypothetical protein
MAAMPKCFALILLEARGETQVECPQPRGRDCPGYLCPLWQYKPALIGAASAEQPCDTPAHPKERR